MSAGASGDFTEMQARLERAQSASVASITSAVDATLSLEEERRILKARAVELAREPLAAIDPRDLIEIVEFSLAGERYGIELACVREVCPLKELTPVPGTPAFVLGIINLRGEIFTVIDLKRFFDLPATGITELNKVLILDSAEMRLGILADAIRGVRRIARAELSAAMPTLTGARAEYLRGVTGERLIVLDAAKILGSEAMLVAESAESQAPGFST